MSYQRYLLGLTPFSLNLLSTSCGVVLICFGIRIAKASDVALRVANTQLITSSSADRLSKLADELDTQAELIKQKDIAYQQLSNIYQQSLKGQDGYGRLQNAIETVGELPEVEQLESIQTEISATEKALTEITTE
jgi:hypothetical protein